MHRFDWQDLFRPLFALLFALTVFACDGGGCGGCEECGIQPIPGAYPLDHRIDNAAQIRLTSGGIGFIEDNISGIVTSVLPDGLDFPIPRVTQDVDIIGEVTICPSDDCSAHIEIENLDLSPTDPNLLLAHLRLVLDSRDTGGDRAEWVLDTSVADCELDIDTRRGSRTYIGLVATLAFQAITEPARAGYTELVFQSIELAEGEGIEDQDIDISPVSFLDAIQCGLLNLGAIKGLVIDQVEGQLGGLVDGALGDQLCQTRGEYGCPTGTFAVPDEDPDSTCRYTAAADAACVPILLGMDGRGDLGGTLIGGFSPGTHAYAQFLLASGGDGEAVNEGMSLFFYGGFMGTDRTFATESTPAHHPCVPIVPPPTLPDVARIEAFRGNVIPGTTNETHVGIGIAEDYMNYAAYGMFDSGMLCIGAGTRLSQQLSSGLVSAAIMSLPELTFPLGNAPLTIAVRPQLAPIVAVGAGTETEPLLGITLPSVEIDFYIWSTERYVRFMTFRTDLALGINLAVEGGQIVPTLTSVVASNSTVSNSELLEEDPAFLASTLQTLIGGFAGMLGSAISPFDLPEIMGFLLDVPAGGLTRVTEGTLDGGEDFLGIFANLALAAPAPSPFTAIIETELEVSDLQLDRRSMTPETWASGDGNSVWLHFSAQGPLAVEYEHSYRIDGGPWSSWTRESRVRIDDEILLLQARHEIEARSRLVGEPATVDTTPALQELVIDILPPTIRVTRTVQGIEVQALDVITEADALEYRYFVDGAWTAWGAETSQALAVDAGGVLVEVRDESGNVGRSEAALIRGLPNASAEGGCSCRAVGEGDESSLPLGLLSLLGAGLALAFRARRSAGRSGEGNGGGGRNGGGSAAGAGGARPRRRFPFTLLSTLSLVALLASGCECSSGPPCGGICIYAVAPVTSGTVCCTATDMCAAYDISTLCDPGYTCSDANLVADGTCTVSCLMCEAKPDLDPGILATHLDSVVDTGGQVYVSGYSPGSAGDEQLYGDLVFGAWNGTAVDWEIVDGQPNGPITNNPMGYREGISEPGDDVGQWTSLANQGGTFLIAYYDVSNGALKLAAGGPGAWQVHTVDDIGDSGLYGSMVLSAAGVPSISYLRVTESTTTPGQIESAIMVATASNANPSTGTDWTLTQVASAPVPCRQRYCSTGRTCTEDGPCVAPTSDCSAACDSGTVCFSGSCRTSIPANYVEDMPPFYGLYTSLAVTSSGLAVVWYDRSTGNIFGSAFDGTTWAAPILIDGYAVGDPFTGDSGMSADLAVDASGVWHVVYIDGAEETLRYAQIATDGTVTREVVDDGSTDGTNRFTDGRHIVGDDASIAVLATGGVRVVYQDATAQHAVAAVRPPGGGAWVIAHFDTADSTGYWLDQELLGTTSYAVSWWTARAGRDTSNGVRVTTLE